MDTQEKRPARRPPNRRSASKSRKVPQERPVSRTGQKRPAASGEQSARQRRTRAPQNARPPQKTRVVRPPREDIPEVVYTAPKPIRKGKLLLKLFSVVAVVLAVVLALSIFFRVDTIQVAGMEKYTPWMIREASGIQEGDSLLGVSKAKVAGKIIAKLPYVDRVKIGINLPGTVNIEITELKVTYGIQATDSSWWLITSDGRVVEQIDTTAASGYTKILGVQVEAPRKDQQVHAAQVVQETQAPDETETTEPATEETDGGEETEATVQQPTENGVTIPTQPQFTAEQKLQIALEIVQDLEKNELFGQIASIDVSDAARLTMEYGKRFHVVLGNSERLEYKISYMAQAVKQLQNNDAGELDVSFEFSEDALLTPTE